MNKEEAKAELEKFLSDIRFHHSLTSELLSILKNSGSEGKFFRLFATRLKYLSEFGRSATSLQPRAFEALSHDADGICSMRLSGSEFNIRILYGFLPSGKLVLLLAFYERSGKRASDYTSNISAAKKRLTEILEETDHECE